MLVKLVCYYFLFRDNQDRMVSCSEQPSTWRNFTLPSNIAISIYYYTTGETGQRWAPFLQGPVQISSRQDSFKADLWSCGMVYGVGPWSWSSCTANTIEPQVFSVFLFSFSYLSWHFRLEPLQDKGCVWPGACQVPILAEESQHSCDMNDNSNNKGKAWPSVFYYGNVSLRDSRSVCAAASLAHSVLEKTPLYFWLSLCGLKMEKACSDANCLRCGVWKETHNQGSIIQGHMLWYLAVIKFLVSPPKQVMITSPKQLPSEITTLPGAETALYPHRLWMLLPSFRHLWVMTGLWLSSKSLHLQISFCSGSYSVSWCNRALGCPPCPSPSVCCWCDCGSPSTHSRLPSA